MNSTIKIFVPDATYPVSLEDEFTNLESESFMRGLEAEFGGTFREANIGPGFDIPSFVTIWSAAALGTAWLLFLKGKEVEESFDAWLGMARRLRAFLYRRATFDRNGAAVLAVDLVFQKLDQHPRTLTLEGCDTRLSGLAEDEPPSEIHQEPDDIQLGILTHRFIIRADEKRFLVEVEGPQVQITQLP